jgi:hypothetical protein
MLVYGVCWCGIKLLYRMYYLQAKNSWKNKLDWLQFNLCTKHSFTFCCTFTAKHLHILCNVHVRMFFIQLRKQYKPLHILQSASRFESVLLASIKALQASAQMQVLRNFPFLFTFVFCWTSFACVCTCYTSINTVLIFHFRWYSCNWYIDIKVIHTS